MEAQVSFRWVCEVPASPGRSLWAGSLLHTLSNLVGAKAYIKPKVLSGSTRFNGHPVSVPPAPKTGTVLQFKRRHSVEDD